MANTVQHDANNHCYRVTLEGGISSRSEISAAGNGAAYYLNPCTG